MAICQKETPSVEEVLDYFLNRFPFLYPHSYLCAYRLFDKERKKMMPKLYLETYQEFESFSCDEGLRQESLKPLREKGSINVAFKSLDGDDLWEVPCKDIKSSVDLTETLPLVKGKLEEKGADLLDINLVLRFKGEVVPNPLFVTDSHGKKKKAKKVTTKQFRKKFRRRY